MDISRYSVLNGLFFFYYYFICIYCFKYFALKLSKIALKVEKSVCEYIYIYRVGFKHVFIFEFIVFSKSEFCFAYLVDYAIKQQQQQKILYRNY